MPFLFSITPTNTTGSKVRSKPDAGHVPLPISLPYGKTAYGNKRLTIAEDKWQVIGDKNIQVNQAGDIWLEVLVVDGTFLDVPAYIPEIHLGTRFARITPLGAQTVPSLLKPDS